MLCEHIPQSFVAGKRETGPFMPGTKLKSNARLPSIGLNAKGHRAAKSAPLCKPLPDAKPLDKPVSADIVRRLLDEILDHAVANRGTDCQFFRCYTYNHDSMPAWVDRAERVLATLKIQL